MANLRLTLDVFGTWLQARINEHPDFPRFLVALGRQPDMPDRCTTVLRVGTGADQHDGYFEEVPFRLQTRGRSESLEDAERFALMVDDIMDSQCNNTMLPVIRGGTQVGGVWVTDCRNPNKPKQVPITDKQSRFQFTADYLVVASRFNEEV